MMLYHINCKKHKESSGESGIVMEFAVAAFHQKWVGKVKKCQGIFSDKFLETIQCLFSSNSSIFRR